MNTTVARILNLRPGGNHAADPLTRPEPVAEAPTEVMHGIASPETLAALVARAEAEQGEFEGASDIGVMPRHTIADDYRDLRVFPAVIRGACRAGLTGLGTRGAALVPPPEFGLDFTAGAAADDSAFWAEHDAAVAEIEAGFVRARRWFHREDTGNFPAVTR